MKLDRLKILLVEDDELFRLGLRVRLQQEHEIDILFEAKDGETAIDLAKQHPFDLVLLDIGLPGMGGLETCRQLQRDHPQLPILVLTSHNEKMLITRLVSAGAQGYCLKGVAAEILILAIRSIVAGASWWDATATAEIYTLFQNNSTINLSTPNHLTQREQEILTLISTSKTDREISETLYITPGTVRVHVHTILHKLGVSDRKQAVLIAVQNNLLNLPQS
jgi:two-component system, NarL family, response regulator